MGAWRFSHHWGRTKKKKGGGRGGEAAEENRGGGGLPYDGVWVIMDHLSQKYLGKKFTKNP